jgi:ABC-type glycerol-3-phosphate transport system substrate-binding protein
MLIDKLNYKLRGGKMKKLIMIALVVCLALVSFLGCPASSKKVTLIVLTHRTDLVDNVFQDYVKKFNEKYPNITIQFEATTDYEGETKIRLSTDDYGDVLNIPGIPSTELPVFFEKLGTVKEMEPKYNFITSKVLGEDVYGIPTVGNAQGILYNTNIWKAAGITSFPATIDELIADLKLIKEKTDAIPVYTNYAAGWALTQIEYHRSAIAADPDYVNKLVHDKSPFEPGKPEYVIAKLMYDIAKMGLIEDDPTTTDWESSKGKLAKGEIACMFLGSWAITQMQAFAAKPSDVGYMPFPASKNGVVYASAGADYCVGINKNSKHKKEARIWLDWFISESGFAASQGGIPPVKGQNLPETLKGFQDLKVQFIIDAPVTPGEEGWYDKIDKGSEVALLEANIRKRIIEAAIGQTSESFEAICADLNKRWGEKVKEVTGK